jgi:hypothetical protein
MTQSYCLFAAEARAGTFGEKQILDTKNIKENCHKDKQIIQETGLLRNTVEFSQEWVNIGEGGTTTFQELGHK